MIAADKLTWMRQRLLELSEPSPEWWSFIRNNKIDLRTVLPDCGSIVVTWCKAVESIDGQFIFDFHPDGTSSVVIEGQLIGLVDGVHDFIVEDLIAWPIGSPDYFATAMGPASGVALLGPVAAFRTPKDQSPLKLFRNPASWLLNRCDGSVVLKPEAAHWLRQSNAPLICEDAAHARYISQLLGCDANKRDILIPEIRSAA